MTKLLSIIIAATFAAVSVSAIAASHAGAQGDKMGKGDAKKPSAEECKKDPKMKGCEPAKK
jgi:Ni/Co efflux regulator RcnB